MRSKIAFLITGLLLITLSLYATGQSREDLRKQVSVTYMSQVGVAEATGNNDGIMVERYLASADLKAGDPWCAAFVNWCFEQNGIEGPKNLAGYSPAWFPKDRHSNDPPLQADIFGIYYASKGRIAHVGFIDRWQCNFVITVEGNTNEEGSRDGGSVLIKRRLARQISITSDWISYRNKIPNCGPFEEGSLTTKA
jgi:hypothetical protein